MPFKSKAQQRYMHAAAERGEIKKKDVKEFDESTDFSKLPERVKEKKASIKEEFLKIAKHNGAYHSKADNKANKKARKAREAKVYIKKNLR